MGDQKGGASLPEALVRTRTVQLEGGEVVTVERWSFSRMLQIIGFLEKELESIPKESLDRVLSGNAFQAALRFMQLLGGRVIGFLRISVSETDRERITQELSAEDVMELVDAVLELNLSERLLKKGTALWARYQPRLKGAK